MVDVGIGSGAFIELRNKSGQRTCGFDVNPIALKWLTDHGVFQDPWQGAMAASFWDVLEHIPNFPDLISKISDWVFVSIPIFEDGEHVLRSKHYRKDEHVWYFTARGLINVFADCGFDLVDMSRIETDIGREDIGSFAFKRVR